MSHAFIMHGSYEERCLGVLLGSSLPEVEAGLVLSTPSVDGMEKYRFNVRDALSLLAKKGAAKPKHLIVRRDRKVEFLNALNEYLSILPSDAQIAFDTTAFPRDRLLMALNLIRTKFNSERVKLYYTSPRSYATDSDEPSWLADGVKTVEAVPGFNGRQRSRAKCLLVLQLGHEKERPQIIANGLEPDRVILFGQGEVQYRSDANNVFREQNDVLYRAFRHKIIEDIPINYNDWKGVRDALVAISDRFDRTDNIFISPNGTKLQCLGMFAACVQRPNIQVIYAQPQYYNPDASSGIGSGWSLGLSELLDG